MPTLEMQMPAQKETQEQLRGKMPKETRAAISTSTFTLLEPENLTVDLLPL